jgi:hypothetical protein
MRSFCDIVGGDQTKNCCGQFMDGHVAPVQGRLARSGLLDRWFDFKRNALHEQAIEWCSEMDIAFE